MQAIAAAVKTMRKGEEVRLSVAPSYGFGEEGRGAEVPPNARLDMELALLGYSRVEKVKRLLRLSEVSLRWREDEQRAGAEACAKWFDLVGTQCHAVPRSGAQLP